MWPWEKFITAGVFLLAYIFFVLKYDRKHITVWSAILITFILGLISFDEAWHSINWNVIGIFVGMFVLSELFIDSRMPDRIANYFANRSYNAATAMIWMCAISGAISIFIENVATVLIVAPVALKIADKLKASPVPFIIGVAVCSNLQGVATLVGDPPSMIMGAQAGMTFNDFFIFQGSPSLFFAVQVGAVAGLVMLYLMFRKYTQAVPDFPLIKAKSMVPSYLLIAMIVLLAAVSFVPLPPPWHEYSAGIICMLMALLGSIWYIATRDGTARKLLRSIDYETTVFLIGIFVLVQTLTAQGIIQDMADLITHFSAGGVLGAYLIIVASAVVFSAFVDNVPYVTTMLPVALLVSQDLGVEPYLLYFGLLIGASVGGNITPIGASANIVGMGILKKQGFRPGFWGFVKIGLPFTLIAVAASSAFVWFFFS